MHVKEGHPFSKPLSSIKTVVIVFFISVVFVLGGACSREEEQAPQKPRVVVPIQIPEKESAPVELAMEITNSEQEELASVVTEPAAPEEKKADSPPLMEKQEKQAEIADIKEEEGCYKVQKGDSLFKIAGREDIYGDPLKWPSLFLLNMDILGGMKVARAFKLKWSSLFELNPGDADAMKVLAEFESEELPEGLKLKFVTAQKAKENLAEVVKKNWVVNVISSQNSKTLVRPAITLMKNGYRVYISKATVKEKDWMRLRVGFYATYQEAAAVGKKIMSILKEDEAWVTRIAQSELENFGGY